MTLLSFYSWFIAFCIIDYFIFTFNTLKLLWNNLYCIQHYKNKGELTFVFEQTEMYNAKALTVSKVLHTNNSKNLQMFVNTAKLENLINGISNFTYN